MKNLVARVLLFLPINLVVIVILLIADIDSIYRFLVIFVLDVSMIIGLEMILKEVKSESD